MSSMMYVVYGEFDSSDVEQKIEKTCSEFDEEESEAIEVVRGLGLKGFTIDIDKLPKGVKKITVVNSW